MLPVRVKVPIRTVETTTTLLIKHPSIEKLFLTPWFIFDIVACSFYIFVLTMIITSNQRLVHGAFFTIVIFTGIVDLLSQISNPIYIFMIAFKINVEDSYLANAVMTMEEAGVTLHVFCNFLATICHYMAICWSIHFKKVWTRRRVFVYLLLITLVTIAVYWVRFTTPNKYEAEQNGSLATFLLEDQTAEFFQVALAIFYILVSPLLSWRTFVSLRRSTFTKEVKNHYRGLALVVLFDCILFFVEALKSLHKLYSHLCPEAEWPQKYYYILNILLYVTYLTSTANPVVLVVFCQTARREVFRFLRRKTTTAKVRRISSTWSTEKQTTPGYC